ncbi:MAG: neutral/alkaline non-lysosomal ceramidase N-terminal domain-containing protein [Traorella sp.]
MVKISTSKICITPDEKHFPCYLCGHAIRTDLALGVMHDIYCKVLAIKNETKTLLWVSFELIGLSKEFRDRVSKKLCEKYGLKDEDIVLSFVHTHSAPECMEMSFTLDDQKALSYMEYVEEKMYLAISECMNQQFKEVNAQFKVTNIDGYYCNRNGKDRLCDKDITVVVFKDKDNHNVASICNFTCHPTVLGPQNLYISSDLAGYLANAIENDYGCNCFTMQGAAGDMSNRLYREGNDEKELNRIGSGIIQQIQANEQVKTLNLDDISETRVFKYRQVFKQSIEKKQMQLRDCEEKVKNAKTFDEKKVYTSALAHAKNEVENFKDTFTLDITCKYYKIGELSVFTMPAELFSRFGIEIKKQMANKCNIFWGYADYSVGYLYNKEDAGESFESAVSDIPYGTTEEIIQQILEFIG